MQDGAAVTGLAIAGASLVAVHYTGNAMYDPIGSILVGNLLGMVKRIHKTANVPAIWYLFLFNIVLNYHAGSHISYPEKPTCFDW